MSTKAMSTSTEHLLLAIAILHLTEKSRVIYSGPLFFIKLLIIIQFIVSIISKDIYKENTYKSSYQYF